MDRSDPDTLRLCRSLLFLPASNPRAIAKARTLVADMIILDLEDAVKPADKAAARAAAVAAAAEGFGASLVAIRVNSPGTFWDADVQAVATSAADYVVVPRTSGPADVVAVASATGKPVLAMVETAQGVLAVSAIAEAGAGLIAGTNDLAADLGIGPGGGGRSALVTALQTILIAARAAGVAAFDGVYNRLDDRDGFALECDQGRIFGFDGKSLIHPSQVDIANRLFGPGKEELERARRLVAAATGGAERFEGEMIERMHVLRAHWLLARADERKR